MRLLLLTASLLYVSGTSPSFAQSTPRKNSTNTPEITPKAILDRAQAFFDSGEFKKASSTIDPLFKDAANLAKEDLARLYLLRARLEYAYVGEEGLRVWLTKLAEVDPEYRLDPVKDPPIAHSIWKEVKAKQSYEIIPPQDNETANQRVQREVLKVTSFWGKIIPFGVGHFEAQQYPAGFAFLASEIAVISAASLLSRPKVKVTGEERRGESDYSSSLGTFGFLGLWGYEVADLVPEMYRIDPIRTESIRFGLSFFPFGAGQFKNGQTEKAVGFAATQAALLTTAAVAPSEAIRDTTMTVFFLSAIYGAYDGWVNHVWDYHKTPQSAKTAFIVSPYFNGAGLGLSLSFGLK